mmetsp:Transcript_15945/g.24145  ORF Transcript_15945/g.24145 Transcript_15945/m.24145 type:complete len:175 (-) Transcript_15945:107-631(-)|eukprot:CAMPEP_0178907866 /NCGR_PEP_ID=MMETSP0786-20121207/7607_1 /TAXON_ID=186022 /ORGANISM="Thalassionema frauenfeldii, Strain CCMP 1798" /LENGTH=174 /DNA_ID=CAMNT_0020579709 /DNA_START=294 /DNA_END=818 /DNA_ORIENTATION=+
MALSSLLVEESSIDITFSTYHDQLPDLSWSDIPVIEGQERITRNKSLPASYLPSSESCSNLPISHSQIESSALHGQNLIERRMHRKTVSFNKVLEIRQHSLTIGDHPSCRDSLPISLDWEHSEPILIDVDGFEAQRKGVRRRGNEMRLSYLERKSKLQCVSGLTEAEMSEYCRI